MKCKGIIASILTAAMLTINAFAIDLYVYGRKLEPDVPPISMNSRTLVPLRAIFESLDAQVLWNSATNTATATKKDTTVSLSIGSSIAYVDGQSVKLDVPAQTIGGRTMVPVRFVSEALGADVWWESDTETVYVVTTTNYDGYRLAPKVIFSTPAEQNGLSDTFMYVDGTVSDFKTVDGYETCIISTDSDKIAIMRTPLTSGWNALTIDQEQRVYFKYLGFSNALQTPAGALFEVGDLNVTPRKSDASLNQTSSTAEPKPESPSIEVPVQKTQTTTIYITRTGKRYHYNSNCNGGTYIQSTLADALSRGLTPCNKCVQ